MHQKTIYQQNHNLNLHIEDQQNCQQELNQAQLSSLNHSHLDHSAVFDDLQRRSTTFATLNHLFEKNDPQREACDRVKPHLNEMQKTSLIHTSDTKHSLQSNLRDCNSEQMWQLQRQQFYEHFKNQISVCSCIAYCDCYLHDTISILFVQNKYYKNNKEIISKLVLPGGKRDIAGSGRAQFKQTDESCWEAMKGEFREETNIDITPFCKGFCPYFNQNHGDKRIRTYFIKIHCSQISNKEYPRLRLYESFRRTWVELDTIVADFMTVKTNKNKMIISPSMINTIRLFANKFTNHLLKIDLKYLYDLDKLFKLITLFSFINLKVYKSKRSIFDKIKQIKYKQSPSIQRSFHTQNTLISFHNQQQDQSDFNENKYIQIIPI